MVVKQAALLFVVLFLIVDLWDFANLELYVGKKILLVENAYFGKNQIIDSIIFTNEIAE